MGTYYQRGVLIAQQICIGLYGRVLLKEAAPTKTRIQDDQ
jgi:hypothetical protein